MKSFTLGCGTLLACALFCRAPATAAPPPPWNFTSKAAIKAKTEFDSAVRAARMKLIQDLEAAQDAATKATDLDEAVKIKDSVKLLKSGEEPPRNFKLQQRLKGTRWAWGKKFEVGRIRLVFAGGTYSMVEPSRTMRGQFQATSKWSVRLDDKRDLIFSRDFRRFVLITSKGEIRTGVRLR